MLITQKIQVKITSKLINFYKAKGYKFNYNDNTFVLTKDLSVGSHVKVIVECDVCHSQKEIEYRGLRDKINYTWVCFSCLAKEDFKTGKRTVNPMFKDFNAIYHVNRDRTTDLIKSKKTKKEKYGDEYYTNREKRASTMIKKYGVDNFSNSKKREKTMNERYGGFYNNTEKSKKTFLERYGVDSASKVPEFFHKMQVNAFQLKQYKNYDLFYRGSYEYDFLELCEKNNLLKYITGGKTIRYNFKNKKCVYYPDFCFRDKNLIIEIKSNYTYKKDFGKNQQKRKACIDEGYNFIFIINKKYDKFLKFIK